MHPTKSQSLIVLNTTSYLLGRILKVNCQIQVDPISSNLGVFVNGMCIVFPMEEGRRGGGGVAISMLLTLAYPPSRLVSFSCSFQDQKYQALSQLLLPLLKRPTAYVLSLWNSLILGALAGLLCRLMGCPSQCQVKCHALVQHAIPCLWGFVV